jgi:gliding motility-associated-like protein
VVQSTCPERCVPQLANIITPNGDGLNDQLKLGMRCNASALRMVIYNRWGQLVYESRTPRNTPGWDVSINGEPASEGTYFYVLTYQDEQGTARRYHGSFTLVR